VTPSIRAVPHGELTRDDLDGLRALFDAEYSDEFGDWHPDLPYGYAPHDVHVVARDGVMTLGHVGWARRVIGVGEREVVIAGVGGVLVSRHARGLRLGEELMAVAVASMKAGEDIEFGSLGCREAVVPFSRACGWSRVTATEWSHDRT